jgi:hypothetical protein
LEATAGDVDPAQGMTLLKSVAQNGETPTRWSWIFDLTHKTARLAFAQDYQSTVEFNLEP